MSNPRYNVITFAACEPGYLDQAVKHVGGFAAELKSKAGAVGVRYGVLGTGNDAGSLVLIQSYNSLGDVEKVFQVYAESDDYQAVINSGKISVSLRNIAKLEDVNVSNPSSDAPKYGVLTLFDGPLMMDRMPEVVPIFESNGAMVMRYGTMITGSNAGKRGLAVGYPSMDAIEKTYDALRASSVYQKIQSEISLKFRNIVRIMG